MKISELIQVLESAKEKYGDLDVVVQYRDDGGYYSGSDSELCLEVEDNNLVL